MDTNTDEPPEEEAGEQFRLEHILGARSMNDGIFALDKNDERSIVFSASNHIVVQNVATNSQRVVESGPVCAMAVNHSQSLVGAAERGTGVVKFYDAQTLRCKRRLGDDSIADVRHVSLSRDSAKCLVLGGPPDHVLTMWDVERCVAYSSIRLSTVTKHGVASADVSMSNSTVVSVIGRKLFRLFLVSSKNSKFVPVKLSLKMEPQNFLAQRFLGSSGELVVGAESGTLVVMGEEERETKQILKVERSVDSIAVAPRGFVVGCGRSIVLFQRSRKDEGYSATKTFRLDAEVTALAVMKRGPLFDAICLMRNQSIVEVPLATSDKEGAATELVPSLNQSLRSIDSFDPSSGSLIVDTCAWKPIVAIGGYDGVVRLFNHRTRRTELTHRFDSKICGLGLHPSGEYLLVSTPKSVLLCSVLAVGLNVSWRTDDLQRPALVRFSQGGDRFAIATGTIVQLHDFHASFENVSTLRGHSKAIVDVSFRGHKDELITVGGDGVVCLWDINRGIAVTRTVDVSSPAYLAGCVSHDHSHVFACSADFKMKKVDVEQGEHVAEAKRCDPKCNEYGAVMAALPDMIIVASNDDVSSMCGSLAMRHCFGQSKVTSIACEEKRLISADREGFVAIYSQASQQHMVTPDYLPLNECSIILRSDFESKVGDIKSLEKSIETHQREHSMTWDSLKSEHTIMKAKTTEDGQLKVDRLRYEVGELTDEIMELKAEHESQMNAQKNQHGVNLKSAMEDCEKKLALEQRTTQRLVENGEKDKRQFQAQLTAMANDHIAAMESEMRSLHQLTCDENDRQERIIAEMDSLRGDTSELEQKMDEDAEGEIAKLSAAHQARTKSLRRSNKLLLNEKEILRQRHVAMLEDLKELQEQVSAQEGQLEFSKDKLTKLDASNEATRAALVEHERAISNQERDICFFSQAVLESEHSLAEEHCKLKVLEDTLRNEEVAIEQKEKETKQKKEELKKAANARKVTRLELNQLKLKLKWEKLNLESTKQKYNEKQGILLDLEKGIAQAISHMDDHKSLKADLCSLSDIFLRGERIKKTRTASNAEKLTLIDKKIWTMTDAIERKEKAHASEMKKLRREHRTLENELEDAKNRAKENSDTAKYKFKELPSGPLSESKLINEKTGDA